jgi:DNA replication protein DnaC|tara:strand:+ start:160 stop:738 length:579 start_codon:yes stop_codon:yes gene_type:complete
MRTLEETLKNATHIKVRDFQRYSFGNIKECKELFVEAFKLVDKTISEYKHLDEYNHVISWLSDTKGKGLFLIGNCGRGKSVILTGVLPLIFNAKKGKILKPIASRKLHQVTEYKTPFIVIDDIGTEEIINDYGTKIDAVENAIFEAEDDLKLLLLTSNLDAAAIKQRYGERIYDRIKRLCKVVFMKGESLRK